MKMLKLLSGILPILFIVTISACNAPEEGSENQDVNSPEAVTQGDQPEVENSTEGEPATETQSNATLTGSEIIDNVSNKMKANLQLDDQQYSSVKDILTKTFLESGEELTRAYEIEKSKAIGKEIRQKSSALIMEILSDSQKEQYNNKSK